jgi:hypothetical protein
MRLRQGTHNPRIVYLQTGTEIRHTDEKMVAVFFTEEQAAMLVEYMNAEHGSWWERFAAAGE